MTLIESKMRSKSLLCFVSNMYALCVCCVCVVLYCVVLYCIVLYCIVLYCIVLYCTFSVLFLVHVLCLVLLRYV